MGRSMVYHGSYFHCLDLSLDAGSRIHHNNSLAGAVVSMTSFDKIVPAKLRQKLYDANLAEFRQDSFGGHNSKYFVWTGIYGLRHDQLNYWSIGMLGGSLAWPILRRAGWSKDRIARAQDKLLERWQGGAP